MPLQEVTHSNLYMICTWLKAVHSSLSYCRWH